MSRDKKNMYVSWQKKFAKAKITIDDNEIFDAVIISIKKRDRFKKIISINENDEYLSSLNKFEKNVNHIIWKFQKKKHVYVYTIRFRSRILFYTCYVFEYCFE